MTDGTAVDEAASISAQEVALTTGQTSYKLRRAAGKVGLTPRQRLLAEFMVYGTDHVRARRLGIPISEPLTLVQAAAVLSIRRRNARQIFALPLFQAELARMLGDLRSGAKARALNRLIKLIDRKADDPLASAADATVNADAARALLDDGPRGLQVNVNVDNRQFQVKPGFIIRQPAPKQPVTIDTVAREQLPATNAEQFEPAETSAFDNFVQKWRP
jgi:hypothetical protein